MRGTKTGSLWSLKVSRQSVDSRQLRIEDCLPGDRLEAESRAGVLSDAMATQNREDDEQASGGLNTLTLVYDSGR